MRGGRVILGGALRAARASPQTASCASRLISAPTIKFQVPAASNVVVNATPSAVGCHVAMVKCNSRHEAMAILRGVVGVPTAQADERSLVMIAGPLGVRGLMSSSADASQVACTRVLAVKPMGGGGGGGGGGNRGNGGGRSNRGGSSSQGEEHSKSGRSWVAFAAMSVVSAKALAKTAMCEGRDKTKDQTADNRCVVGKDGVMQAMMQCTM
jgi:hypothetical protein